MGFLILGWGGLSYLVFPLFGFCLLVSGGFRFNGLFLCLGVLVMWFLCFVGIVVMWFLVL